jgi:thioredoxin-related protein
MYYSQTCSYCNRIFYTFEDNKERASHVLFKAIKQHLIESGEDDKEYKYDDGETEDANEIYGEMTSANEPPSGGYEVS